MTLTNRDRRALVLLGIALGGIVVYRAVTGSGKDQATVAPDDSIPAAEKRLARLREVAATVPGKQDLYRQVATELSTREKGVIQAETAAQAQAQLFQVSRRIGTQEGIVVRGGEVGQVRPLGNDYGEVSVAVSFECGIEQLVNFLADLTKEPELLSTSEIHLNAGNPKAKTVVARIVLSGVVPKKLVPVKKASF